MRKPLLRAAQRPGDKTDPPAPVRENVIENSERTTNTDLGRVDERNEVKVIFSSLVERKTMRRIVLCFDGTWNKPADENLAAEEQVETNVCRFYRSVKETGADRPRK
jgi:Uncharacterized alpha/beta hydrolase domain (DUF2235)